ncbi:hypothetical protein LXA43DRAFT_1066016 [Ganoderma leucocontextum]|nr:hypothetical protein LXA43DRAFT_1066016 [Ganoderma leucocontextum]
MNSFRQAGPGHPSPQLLATDYNGWMRKDGESRQVQGPKAVVLYPQSPASTNYGEITLKSNIASPIIQFAAVTDVQYASTNDIDPVPSFARGGVILSELAPGEFGMVITGHSYSVTIVAVTITDTWKIISDSDRLEVHFSPWGPREQLYSQTWLYLRFKRSAIHSDFNRVLWNIFRHVQSKAQLLQSRLDDIGYARPSNFTRYCRQYLGEDYFDQLTDSEESDADNEDTPSDDNTSQPDWSDEAEGSSGSDYEAGGSGSEATVVDGHRNA